MLCHKAAENANRKIPYTDDKRNEKEEEESQSLMLSTSGFQLLCREKTTTKKSHRGFIPMICTLFGSSALVSSGMRCLEELGIQKEKNIECSLTVIFGASFNQVAKPLGVIAEGAGFSVKQVLIK